MLKIKAPRFTAKKIVSFGLKHHGPVRGSMDVRPFFTNPYSDLRLRALTGKDPEVGAYIEANTPDFETKFQNLVNWAKENPRDTLYLACFGGRHRSVYLAEKLGKLLGLPVEHWDLDRSE